MLESCTTTRLNLIIIGAPGSGKGTQSKRVSEKYSLVHVTSGDLLREASERQTESAVNIRDLMKTGKLFPDEIVKKVLADNVPTSNFILDGYPRKISQVATCKNIDLVIFIDLPNEECIKRVLHRNENRTDDNEEAVKKRITCFKNETEPVIEYYKSKNILETIDGNGTEDEVYGRICEVIIKRFNI